MVPVAVTCSYAFMLPVATPPNAIVFAAAKMRPLDMVFAAVVISYIKYTKSLSISVKQFIEIELNGVFK